MIDTDHTPYYHSGEKSTYEIDFLIQIKENVIAPEVKAENNLKSKSLKVYHDRFQPPVSLKISASDYIDRGWMKNIPLWCINGI